MAAELERLRWEAEAACRLLCVGTKPKTADADKLFQNLTKLAKLVATARVDLNQDRARAAKR